MKTLKIKEQTHERMIDIQNKLYQRTKNKYTFDEIINIGITSMELLEIKYDKKQEVRKYHFDDEQK